MMTTQSPPRDVAFPARDGLTLRAWHWSRPNPRGIVVISHGFGEHGGCYRHVATALGPGVDIDVLAPDFRGHGRSPGRRGVVKRYEELVSDLRSALDWAGHALPGLPRFVLGHSNGGQVALRLALDDDPGLSGMILSNPSLALATHVPRGKLKLGRWLNRVAPWVTLSAKLPADRLTRDPAMQREHRTDPLRHSRMSPRLFFGMVEGGPMIAGRAAEVSLPILMVLGGADTVIDPEESRRVFEWLGSEDKTLDIFPRMLHEPFNEIGREKVLADAVSWLAARLGRA